MKFYHNFYMKKKIEKRISYVCSCDYEFFLKISNVQGIGCGYKVKNGFFTEQLCIQVFVSRKISSDKINVYELVPNIYKGIVTDVIEVGIFRDKSLNTKIRPVIGGYDIGNDFRLDLNGTMTCLVADKNHYFILSCNHVLANNNLAPLGTKIIQPSHVNHGQVQTDVIATLYKFIPKKSIGIFKKPVNYADCAIAKVTNKSLVSPKIALVGIPQEPVSPELNQEVKKVGSITELTTGRITSINATITINSSSTGKKYLFKDQILSNAMIEFGDSGSLLLDKNNRVLGLCMGGGQGDCITNPINYILKELNVRIVSN